MASTNDITGDSIVTKATSEEYRNNYDLIFGKKDRDIIKSHQPIEEKSHEETSDLGGTGSN